MAKQGVRGYYGRRRTRCQSGAVSSIVACSCRVSSAIQPDFFPRCARERSSRVHYPMPWPTIASSRQRTNVTEKIRRRAAVTLRAVATRKMSAILLAALEPLSVRHLEENCKAMPLRASIMVRRVHVRGAGPVTGDSIVAELLRWVVASGLYSAALLARQDLNAQQVAFGQCK